MSAPESFQPLAGWLLLRRRQPSDQTPGQILLPSSTDVRNITEVLSEVVAVGGQSESDGYCGDSGLRRGDLVVHRGYLRHVTAVGEVFAADPDEYFLLRVEDVYGTVTPGSGLRIGAHGEYVA